MPGGASGGAGGGYNYVQDSQPSDPKEGEEWYDTAANAAYVYDGAAWVEQTVVDHGQLSGVASGDHHARYADSEARQAVDGSSLSALDITDTFTDPAGVPHSSEMAEQSDIPTGTGTAGPSTKKIVVYSNGGSSLPLEKTWDGAGFDRTRIEATSTSSDDSNVDYSYEIYRQFQGNITGSKSGSSDGWDFTVEHPRSIVSGIKFTDPDEEWLEVTVTGHRDYPTDHSHSI